MTAVFTLLIYFSAASGIHFLSSDQPVIVLFSLMKRQDSARTFDSKEMRRIFVPKLEKIAERQ
jgi:hypothetical protein